MICYVYKVRPGSYKSKKDNKDHSGYNVGLLGLEGIKFALETFIDNKDTVNIFAGFKGGFRVDTDFKPGFYDVDIDEFPVYVPQGTQYQKKVISFTKKIDSIDDVKKFFL